MPQAQFANWGSANHPGVNQSSWDTCFSCSNAVNQCTKVSGSSNATDQFALYRGWRLHAYNISRRDKLSVCNFILRREESSFFWLQGILLVDFHCAGTQLAPLLKPSSDSNCSFLFNSFYTPLQVYAQQARPSFLSSPNWQRDMQMSSVLRQVLTSSHFLDQMVCSW